VPQHLLLPLVELEEEIQDRLMTPPLALGMTQENSLLYAPVGVSPVGSSPYQSSTFAPLLPYQSSTFAPLPSIRRLALPSIPVRGSLIKQFHRPAHKKIDFLPHHKKPGHFTWNG